MKQVKETNIEDVRLLEKKHNQIIREAYEQLGSVYIGKYFKKEHKRDPNISFSRDYTSYLYVYGVSGYTLSGIKFQDISIYRCGEETSRFNWQEITKNEFNEGIKHYIKLFHFDELFNLEV